MGCICFVKALNSVLEVTQYGDVPKLCAMPDGDVCSRFSGSLVKDNFDRRIRKSYKRMSLLAVSAIRFKTSPVSDIELNAFFSHYIKLQARELAFVVVYCDCVAFLMMTREEIHSSNTPHSKANHSWW